MHAESCEINQRTQYPAASCSTFYSRDMDTLQLQSGKISLPVLFQTCVHTHARKHTISTIEVHQQILHYKHYKQGD